MLDIYHTFWQFGKKDDDALMLPDDARRTDLPKRRGRTMPIQEPAYPFLR